MAATATSNSTRFVAGMVERPAAYRWSSYATNAQGEPSTLVTPHPLYTAMGTDANARQVMYRELFRHQLDPGLIDEIRVATNGNYALASSAFEAQATAALARRVSRGKSERPRKLADVSSRDFLEHSDI